MASTQNGTAADGWFPPRERRWTSAQGEAMVEAWRRSGEGAFAFARRHGLHPKRVTDWIRRVEAPARKAAARPISFAPVRVVPRLGELTEVGLELIVKGTVIRVWRGFDEDSFRRVVAILQEGTC